MDEFELPEKPKTHHERGVGLTIAVIAVLLAIVAAYTHKTHNEEILAHVDAADQYAYFQAKKARAAQLTLAVENIRLGFDHLSPASQALAEKALTDHASEIDRLTGEAKEIQKQGDERMEESRVLATRAGILDLGEIALQIAIVLCSISVLTELLLFVRVGIVVAFIGLLVAATALFRH